MKKELKGFIIKRQENTLISGIKEIKGGHPGKGLTRFEPKLRYGSCTGWCQPGSNPSVGFPCTCN